MKPNPKMKWEIVELPNGDFFCESQALGVETIHSAHCSACARVELIQRYGGWVDTRGMYRYDYCYSLLAIINRAHKFGTD